MARECDVTDDSCQPGMHEMLWFTINMVEQSKGRKETWEDLRNAPEWMQLCAVALADAAILGARHQDILEGEAVAQRIRDAYLLARWKVGTVRMSFGPYN